MNGSITVRSELGKGSMFSVILNFKKSAARLSGTKTAVTSDLLLTGYRILAAEDILANQILLKHLLQKWGAYFVICNNGQEALELLQKEKFDLILMDIQMPVMDGITAMQTIRNSLPGYDGVPVIAFTADTFAESTPEIIECNFNDFVTKPFKSEELLQKIKRLVKKA